MPGSQECRKELKTWELDIMVCGQPTKLTNYCHLRFPPVSLKGQIETESGLHEIFFLGDGEVKVGREKDGETIIKR